MTESNVFSIRIELKWHLKTIFNVKTLEVGKKEVTQTFLKQYLVSDIQVHKYNR